METVLAIIEFVTVAASQAELPPELVLAIIEAESSGNRYATRYVSAYPWTRMQAKRPANCTADTESVHQRTAWGLMQVMGGTARQMGFEGCLPELINPETNVRVGVAYLSMLNSLHGEKHGIDGVIAAYNQGAPRKSQDGKYQNQEYVNKVKALMTKYKEIVKGSGIKTADAPEAGGSECVAPAETVVSLSAKNKSELLGVAQSLGLSVSNKLKRDDIEAMILSHMPAECGENL